MLVKKLTTSREQIVNEYDDIETKEEAVFRALGCTEHQLLYIDAKIKTMWQGIWKCST